MDNGPAPAHIDGAARWMAEEAGGSPDLWRFVLARIHEAQPLLMHDRIEYIDPRPLQRTIPHLHHHNQRPVTVHTLINHQRREDLLMEYFLVECTYPVP